MRRAFRADGLYDTNAARAVIQFLNYPFADVSTSAVPTIWG